jgi:O-antigen ligase
MNWRASITVALLLVIMVLCLFGQALDRHYEIFHEFEVSLLQMQLTQLVCFTVWCGCLVFLMFSLNDLPLIGLLLIVIVTGFIGIAAQSTTNSVGFLFGVVLGKGASSLLKKKKQKTEEGNILKIQIFLTVLILLLAFSSLWHLDMPNNFYNGPRWMGLWNNPNDYGMLMSAGVLLAVGLFAGSKNKEGRRRKWMSVVLLMTAFMMGVGLIFSYSRGAWLGMAIGLLYLAKAHGKFKWEFVLPSILVIAAIIFFFWHSTPDTAPWYLKRADLSRPSAQHRVAAWKAGFEIMCDRPFGVGWNKTVETYEKNYSPPENGATAIMTNDYLTLGAQLGIPALVCFVVYVALQLGVGRWKLRVWEKSACEDARPTLDSTKVACRAAALAMLVEFWFDGGLFKLATASVFWILLELGTSPPQRLTHLAARAASAKAEMSA